MNDLNLPPRRTLPPTTRERIRRVVDTGLSARQDPRSPIRRRAPLAVAAGVAVLALGAVMGPRFIQDDATERPAITVSPALQGAAGIADAVDRCAAAVPDLGPRDRWQSVMGRVEGNLAVVGVRIDGKPVICQATGTSVTVTDPATPLGADGTRNTLLLNSAEGVIAGVADPTWHKVGVSLYATGIDMIDETYTRDGFFIVPRLLEWPTADLRLFEYEETWETGPEVRVNVPPPPTVVVDRPGAADGSDQQHLDRCLATTPSQIDRGWELAAGFGWADARDIIVRAGDRLGLCVKGTSDFLELPTRVASTPSLCLLPGIPASEDPIIPQLFAGLAPRGTAYVQLTYESGIRQRLPVVRDSFIGRPTPSKDASDSITRFELVDENNVATTAAPPADC